MSIMDELTYRRIFEGARCPGKSNESLVKLGEALMRGERVKWVTRSSGMSKSVIGEAQKRFLAQKPEKPEYLLGSGRSVMSADQRIVWDEMGLYPGTWQWVDEQGRIHDVGIDWGTQPSYTVITRIGPGKITFERIEDEQRTNQMHAARLERQPDRDRPGAVAFRRTHEPRRVSGELHLRLRGANIPELLRGIRGG